MSDSEWQIPASMINKTLWVKPVSDGGVFIRARINMAEVVSYDITQYSSEYVIKFVLANGKKVEWSWKYLRSDEKEVEKVVLMHLKMCDDALTFCKEM